MPRAESESVNVLVRRIHKIFNLFSVKNHPNMSKRKTDYPESTRDPVKDRHGNCMLHMNDSKMTQIMYFSELDKDEERFQKILDIRVQRLAQPAVTGKEVLTLIDLRDTYVLILADTPFPNTNYRTGKLKVKLLRHKDYCDKLSFVELDRRGGQLQSELVFSNETSLAEAVKNGNMLGCSNMIDEVGKFLHRIIKDAFEKGDALPWSPTASYLQTVDDPVPGGLQRFLHNVICGANSVQPSGRTHRLVSSIGQDICRAATRGR